MMRRMQLTAWLASHKESGPVAELSVGWMDGTIELAERYIRLFGQKAKVEEESLWIILL